MGARYLLDTNIVIAALKGHEAIRDRLERIPMDSLLVSSIVLGELEFGAEKSAYAERNRQRLAELVRRLPLIGVDASAAVHFGRLRADLERQGTPIGANDLCIAAQAVCAEATLVTDNEREFRRVAGLRVENWLAG
jgi:tRNA(fMet)-specific endonuclease VapC